MKINLVLIGMMAAFPVVTLWMLQLIEHPNPLGQMGAIWLVTNGIIFAMGLFGGRYLEQAGE